MQYAKDTFYIVLRDRLAALNPARTLTVNGVTQAAIVLANAQPASLERPPADCFRVSFGAVQESRPLAWPEALLVMECAIAYHTHGTAADGSDRERMLTALDSDLLAICTPPAAPKADYTQTPAQPLGTNIFWQRPRLGEVIYEKGAIGREVKLALFFHSEVSA